MLVVLSDLHFSEAQSNQIGSHRFNRNLPVEAFRAYFSEVNQFAIANRVALIDLILAGDIFEISRSAMWLEGDDRPYINNEDVLPGSNAERTILKIIEAISREEKVAETLVLFRNIQQQFNTEIRVHLIPGNHDRLINATPDIRKTIREKLGLDGGAQAFDHRLLVKDWRDDPFCLVRHGHEYDPTNFPLNTHQMEVIPLDLPAEAYGKGVLGDIMTTEFGASLTQYFKEEYGEEAILADEKLMALYQRLAEFDDVRPTNAWLAYLFSMPDADPRQTWALIRPAFTRVLNVLSSHEQFKKALKQSAAINPIIRVILTTILKSGMVRDGLPFWLMKLIMKVASQSINLQKQVKWAKKEVLVQGQDAKCNCIISGHSHFAEVSLISTNSWDERYYINTGTWRTVIPATAKFNDFGRLKALTKVMVLVPREKPEIVNGRDWAFHYLSGVSFGDHRHV